MLSKFNFVFAFCAVFNIAVQGQTILPAFKHITTNDGLPSSTTYFVMQDSKGFMWFTTDHGVARYNGYEYKIFTAKDGLEDNTVFHLFEDTKSRIWMLTFSGKIFFFKDGKIYPYKYNKAAMSFVKGTAPQRIYVDSADNVFITCRGELKIDNNGNATIENRANPNCNILIHEVSKSCILPSAFYLIKSDKPMSVFYKSKLSVDSITSVPYLFSRVNAVRLSNKDLFFVIGNNFYLSRIGKAFPIGRGDFSEINYMIKDKNNRLLACTDKGLFIYDDIKLCNAFSVYFEGKIITSCCIDNENGFWITTRDNGVYYLPDFAIKHIAVNSEKFEKPVSLASNFEHVVYSAYASGVVTKISGSDEKPIYYSPAGRKIYNLLLDQKNRLLVGGDSSGYINQNKFYPFVNLHYGKSTYTHLKNNFVETSNGLLYSSAQSTLVKIVNDSVKEWIDCNQRINCLFEADKHQLLVGCINGVLIYTDSSKRITPFSSLLTNISIQDIKQKGSYLCFATQGRGLILLDGKNMISITEDKGLASDFVSKILIHDNDVWCATNLGISHIQFTDTKNLQYTITNISKRDGLPDNEINDLAFLNDTIWVATNSGICFFNSSHDFFNSVAPFVYINSISINGVDTNIHKKYSLPHNYNNLKISFRGISFKSQREISYKYLLKANGDSVTGITLNNEVEFLALSAGKYSFYVRAQNSSGVWSTHAAVLSFTILPVWWQTWWFRFCMMAVTLLAGFLLYKNRLKHLKAKYVAERSQAILQLTASRAQMNPHFIFNVMNSIRNYIQKNDSVAAQKYLASFAKLIRYTLDNSNVQEISLEEELSALRIYAELEKQRFENAFEFIINCPDEIDQAEARVPSLILQPFVENAIKHGIADFETGGIITIDIKLHFNRLIISIKDNGTGRNKVKEQTDGQESGHISHGTALSNDRIKAYNKAFNKNITVFITDVKNANGDVCGTQVEIEI